MPAVLALLLLAHPHAAPTLWVDLDVGSREVVLLVTTRLDHLQPWLGDAVKAGDLLEPVTDEARAKALGAVGAVFAKSNPLRIDDVRVVPECRALEVPEDDQGVELLEYATFRLAYACAAPPQRVALRWESFEGASYAGREAVPGVVRRPEAETFELSRETPEYVWHRKPRPRPSLAPLASGHAPRWVLRLLWASLGGLVLAAALGRRRPAVLGVCAAGVAAGVLALVLAERLPRPSPEEARAIFGALHRNVYRSLGAQSEEEIYDLLAASVEKPILTGLYLDVHRSIVLRERGAAVATVRQVEPIRGDVHFGGDAAEFSVDWRWRVHCDVSHWGHTHRRVNEYEAAFVVRDDGESWRIASMKVLDERRVETGG